MGEALVWGLIRSGGRTREELMVTCRREERARDLAERLGVATTLSNPEAVKSAPTLVLTVKPQDMETLLGQIQHYLSPQHLVITFAAGIRTSFIERFSPKACRWCGACRTWRSWSTRRCRSSRPARTPGTSTWRGPGSGGPRPA